MIKLFYNNSLESLLGSESYICTNEGLENCIATFEDKSKICIFGYFNENVDKNTNFTLKKLKECSNITDKNIDMIKKINLYGFTINKIENLVNFVEQSEYEESKDKLCTLENKVIIDNKIEIIYYY